MCLEQMHEIATGERETILIGYASIWICCVLCFFFSFWSQTETQNMKKKNNQTMCLCLKTTWHECKQS